MSRLKKGAGLPAGVGVAFAAAALFGGSTPLSKLLLGQMPPILLAGLLYLGSGIGLSLVRLARRPSTSGPREASLRRARALTFRWLPSWALRPRCSSCASRWRAGSGSRQG